MPRAIAQLVGWASFIALVEMMLNGFNVIGIGKTLDFTGAVPTFSVYAAIGFPLVIGGLGFADGLAKSAGIAELQRQQDQKDSAA